MAGENETQAALRPDTATGTTQPMATEGPVRLVLSPIVAKTEWSRRTAPAASGVLASRCASGRGSPWVGTAPAATGHGRSYCANKASLLERRHVPQPERASGDLPMDLSPLRGPFRAARHHNEVRHLLGNHHPQRIQRNRRKHRRVQRRNGVGGAGCRPRARIAVPARHRSHWCGRSSLAAAEGVARSSSVLGMSRVRAALR